jgi:RNA polymerase sigma-70 factor (ECF subfamily)
MANRTFIRQRRGLTRERLAALYREHAGALLIFFARRTYDPQLASDLVAETFAEAIASRRRFAGASDAEALGWLYGIGRHQLATYFRRGQAEQRALAKLGIAPVALPDEELRRIEELGDLEAMRARITDGLRTLSDEQRVVLQMRVVDELSYGEVAQRLNLREDAVRARVSRGLRALAQALPGDFPNPADGEAR